MEWGEIPKATFGYAHHFPIVSLDKNQKQTLQDFGSKFWIRDDCEFVIVPLGMGLPTYDITLT